jgi:hypothetical protein
MFNEILKDVVSIPWGHVWDLSHLIVIDVSHVIVGDGWYQ